MRTYARRVKIRTKREARPEGGTRERKGTFKIPPGLVLPGTLSNSQRAGTSVAALFGKQETLLLSHANQYAGGGDFGLRPFLFGWLRWSPIEQIVVRR